MRNINFVRLLIVWIVFFTLLTIEASAQTDTINQYIGKKKNGYWPVYLDSLARRTDSTHAYYFAYEFYHAGKNAFKFYDAKWKKKDSVVFSGVESSPGHPMPATGKFTWYDKKNQMITYEENYNNGMPVKFKEIRYKKKGRNYTWAFIRTIDFAKRFRGIPGTYLIQEQNNQAIYNMEEWARYWYRHGKRGWRVYKIKNAKAV